jgi:hypothetical protein
MAKFTDYRRVIGAAQVLFLAGKWLKRKGIRYTSLTVVIPNTTVFLHGNGR